jgi:UDP-GlcNAc:undecaprenyl-phosphate/decaprenyl-phosphate GlcNAc-1-phosphate transferase
MKLDVSLAAIAGFTIILTLLGVYLAGVKVYDQSEEAQALKDNSVYTFLVDVSYKRRIFEVLLDVVLIILAYWSAYAIKFGAFSGNLAWTLFLRTVPVLVFVKMATFLAMGVYRGLWRYTGLDDLIVFIKAVVLSSVASVLVLLLSFRFEGFSRTVFLLDGIFMLLFLGGSRMAFRLFRQLLPSSTIAAGRRVFIYGAGDGGELLLRELQNNRELRYAPVGFLDDDPAKNGKLIHGLKVFAANGDLSHVCRQHAVDEVIISSSKVSEARVQEIASTCNEQQIEVKRMKITIEDVRDI